uniref:CCHC-type domain-containing protein n=1 Tax=Tanacetum cinerariifolium TaxID=118510 RepID=A0A699HAE3_TANCI|nr:hypothetical protein [Tanacetum cinerariifolium]
MTTLAEFMIRSGGDNRPPMLDKYLYDSWKSRMELYMKNREHVHQDACPQPQFIPQIEYTVSTGNQQTHLAEFPQIDSGLTVLVFKQGVYPIDDINKMMAFLSTVVTSHFPSTNNQLRNSSNPRQQARTRANTSRTEGRTSSQQRVVKCFNCQREGHMARQYTEPKRKRDATWFRDKVLLVEAQGNGKVLNEEELEFFVDPGIAKGPVTQTVITNSAAYQANYLDAYDSDCDDITTAKVALMANLSRYSSDVLSKVPYSEHTYNDMLNQSVQEMPYSEQTHLVNYPENEITSDSNNIPSIRANGAYVHEPQVFYDNNLKQVLGFQNPFYLKKAQQIRPMLYDGNAIAKETNVISIADSEETLMLEEESRSKMILKQSGPMVLEKKVNIKLVNYAVLYQLSEDFGKRFVPQQKLCAEQAFWFQMSNPSTESSDASPVKVDVPSELPKDIDEIETINIELEHSVEKLFSENENLRNEREHLKSIYKDQFDSIKKTRVQSKEHSDSLIAQINAKSVENSNLNAQLHEKVFAITALKDELRKLKGKGVVDSAVSKPNAVTIAPGMFM